MMVKKRIVKYLESKGFSKYKFYKDIGVSNGFLDKEGAVGTDKCERIFYRYPDLNLIWLITGEGSMLNSENIDDSKDRIIIDQAEQIRELREEIIRLTNGHGQGYELNSAINSAADPEIAYKKEKDE